MKWHQIGFLRQESQGHLNQLADGRSCRVGSPIAPANPPHIPVGIRYVFLPYHAIHTMLGSQWLVHAWTTTLLGVGLFRQWDF